MKKTFGFNKISGMHKHSANRGVGINSGSSIPTIAQSQLVLNFDASNVNSYSGTGNTWYNLANTGDMTLTRPDYSVDGSGSFVMSDPQGGLDARYGILSTSGISDLNVGTGDFSASMWFKMGNFSTRQLLVSQYSTWTSNFDFAFVYQSNQIRFWAGNGLSLYLGSTTTLINDPSVWYNVCVVRESGVTKLYVNDVLQSSTSLVGSIQNRADLWFGYNKDYDEFMRNNGKIAQFSFYNRALSDSERTANYDVLKQKYGY